MAQGPVSLAPRSSAIDVKAPLSTYLNFPQLICYLTNQIEVDEEADDCDDDDWVETIIMDESPLEPQESSKFERISNTVVIGEVGKCIVYGGLTELIASLSTVTSASSTKDTTGKVVACSLTSLVTGFFVLAYKISELWIEKHERQTREGEEENLERYEDALGDRKNYRLHFSVALLSFVLFGLVPPLTYGFTFRKPEDKILKVSTVTVVAALCIALLGVVKAYIERKPTCVQYVYTIGTCIVDALGTSVLSTIGGDLIENYIEKAGWFEPNKIPTLFQPPGLSFENVTSAWGSW